MTTYYTYVHRSGYGSADHMADEIIARAARRLGADTGHYIAQAVGLMSHAVPMGSVHIRIPAGPGVRRQMERALTCARREVHQRDTAIDVRCYRIRVVRRDDRLVRITDRRDGHRWHREH